MLGWRSHRSRPSSDGLRRALVLLLCAMVVSASTGVHPPDEHWDAVADPVSITGVEFRADLAAAAPRAWQRSPFKISNVDGEERRGAAKLPWAAVLVFSVALAHRAPNGTRPAIARPCRLLRHGLASLRRAPPVTARNFAV